MKCILVAAGLVALLNHTALAGSFTNSLWIGNDDFAEGHSTLYNVDRTGAVLQSFPDSPMTGVAIDPTTSSIYLSAPSNVGGNGSGIIHRYDLNSLTDGVKPTSNGTVPGGDHPYEDMAFNPADPNHLWRANYFFSTFDKIDLTTGAVTSFASPAGVGAQPMGMAWDGTQFWVSDFANGGIYTMTSAGVFSATPVFTPAVGGTGGLAWDTTDSTLWVGAFGNVYHFTTGGTELGHFASPNGGAFVDGLEFQGQAAAPEPGTLALSMIVALLGFGFRRRLQAAVHTDQPRTN